MEDLANLTDELLLKHRPDRYSKGGDDKWLVTVAALVAPHIAEKEAQQIAAEQYVKNREGTKTQKANRYIREIYRTGQLPLDWFELSAFPVAVGSDRVAIRAMTAEDWEQSAQEEQDRADEDYALRMETVQGKFWFAKEQRDQGVQRAADLRI